jgi:hypothetical protein
MEGGERMDEKEKRVRGAVGDLLTALMEREESLAPRVQRFLHRVTGHLSEGSDLAVVLLEFAEELREECRRKVG